MDLMNDEPRKHPQPVPFCKSNLLQPTVPDVSLLLQDDFNNPLEKKSDSFSGTEFQTYNAWRWKHINLNDKKLNPDFKKINKCTGAQDCYLIKDKYASSDIEKRKNEILYGEFDEPRRPLPPRANPLIPKSSELFFSDLSFEDQPISNVYKGYHKANVTENQNTVGNCTSLRSFEKDINNSEKLYSIIQEQNKQLEILHKQIEQFLKLEEVKDKQIEQLLKAQESKEKKIEHLLQSLDSKDKEVEQLLKLKEKQEQHFQDLLKSQEEMQKENLNLLNKLKDITQKDVQSVGVMTHKYVTDASSNTSFDGYYREKSNKEKKMRDEEISSLRDNNESSKLDEKEKSLSLHSSDLPIIQEHVPSPQSSIHVDIQDFHDSSEESDSESVIPSKIFPSATDTTSAALGYTFYNNVLTQVKDIIQKSSEKEKTSPEMSGGKQGLDKGIECNFKPDSHESMHSFHAWGVIGTEKILPTNNEQENILESVERAGYCLNNGRHAMKKNAKQLKETLAYLLALKNIHSNPEFCLKNANSPSDISLKINALAMKYLKHEQISQNELQNPYQHDVTIYNVTNLSFGSKRYLDRYQMLPVNNNQRGVFNTQQNESSPTQFLRRKKRISVQENITSFGNILDINTLNQQPKLL